MSGWPEKAGWQHVQELVAVPALPTPGSTAAARELPQLGQAEHEEGGSSPSRC